MEFMDDENKIGNRRQVLVDQARETWKKKLFDLGRRNSLLYFRDLKRGSLRLDTISVRALGAFLEEHLLVLDTAITSEDVEGLMAKVRGIYNQTVVNREERGVHTCYLSLGLASWKPADGGRAPRAPIWLIPAEVEIVGREGLKARLRRTGDPTWNPILSYVLEENFGVRLLPPGEDGVPSLHDVQALLKPLQQRLVDVPELSLQDTVILGNFSFQKLAMVNDLTGLGDGLVENDVVAALAGDESARTHLFAKKINESVEPWALDDMPAADEFTVLDADSSQLTVIRAVNRGHTGVILGPPGTGKSQTIVNILAESAARGRSVLFVAEKRAALDVVLGRLRDVGLGHLALDLGGADRSKNVVARQLAESLDRVKNAKAVEIERVQHIFADRRERLNSYVKALHASRSPVGMSVFEMLGIVKKATMSHGFRHRIEASVWDSWDSETIAEVEEHLRELGALWDNRENPWFTAVLTTPEAVQSALAAISNLSQLWPQILRRSDRWGDPFRLSCLGLEDVDRRLELWADIRDMSLRYDPAVYEAPLKAWGEDLGGSSNGLENVWRQLTNGRYRAALGQLRTFRLGVGKITNPPMDVRRLLDLKAQWHDLGGSGAPIMPQDLDEIRSIWNTMKQNLDVLARFAVKIRELPALEWWSYLEALAADHVTPLQVARVHAMRSRLQDLSLGTWLDNLLEGEIASGQWVEMFRYNLFESVLDQTLLHEPDLAHFVRDNHERLIEEFRDSDRHRILMNRERVLHQHGQRAIQAFNEYPDQEALIRQEAAKKSRHLPLRKLLFQAPNALLALRPCWVASPLSVSQLLAAQPWFDVVIFDEASQVLPEDAIPSLARGRQAVVAGDNHQLPPTTFFANTVEDAESSDDETPYQGFESVLDSMSGLTAPWSLQWHYRSRDERLIAFSNHHIYGESLVTFPGTGQVHPIQHVLVSGKNGHDTVQDSVVEEVNVVVDHILQHVVEHPDESLGVITMGLKHANRIQMALEQQLARHPELDEFFDPQSPDRFFIKNLERVQGDERDAIILSVGYGKEPNGTLLYRFGPLLQEGGERRLNVAITRARSRMTVISSFDHRDMDPTRRMSRGVELLREFLAYAATKGDILRTGPGYRDIALNPFELMVRDALTKEGLHLVPQWGVSRYRLDFAVQHPERRGEFVLAIECDGASYHSAPTARDRDRLRQQQLEMLGWRFHRIWSTEWFRNPAVETQRAVRAYQDALTRVGVPGLPQSPEPLKNSNLATIPAERAARPSVTTGVPIDQRDLAEVIRMLAWIESDGLLRTDEELLSALTMELGYKRRGVRIEAILRPLVVAHRRR